MLDPPPVNTPPFRSRDADLAHAQGGAFEPACHFFGALATVAETAAPGPWRPEIAELAARAEASQAIA